jgi:hypothetical protein
MRTICANSSRSPRVPDPFERIREQPSARPEAACPFMRGGRHHCACSIDREANYFSPATVSTVLLLKLEQVKSAIIVTVCQTSLWIELAKALNKTCGWERRLVAVPKKTCPSCGEHKVIRVKRRGILQNKVWRWFGWAPWQCQGCRESFCLKDRGIVRRSHRSKGSSRDASSGVEAQLEMRHGD